MTAHERLRLERIEATPGKFGEVKERRIKVEPVQTFAGRRAEPTEAMSALFRRAEGARTEAEEKKKNKAKLKVQMKEKEAARRRGEELRREIHEKSRGESERKLAVGRGGANLA